MYTFSNVSLKTDAKNGMFRPSRPNFDWAYLDCLNFLDRQKNSFWYQDKALSVTQFRDFDVVIDSEKLWISSEQNHSPTGKTKSKKIN